MIPKAPWSILDVSLTDMPEVLERPVGGRAVLVLLWFKGAYLGRMELPANEFPLHRREFLRLAVQAVQPALPALVSTEDSYVCAATVMHRAPAILTDTGPVDTDDISNRLARMIDKRRARRSHLTATIAICTANRPGALRACLQSLEAEILAGRELLIIDNAPSSETQAVVEEVTGARYIAEPKRGLSHARNTALAEGTGDILVFVDDDVRPEPGWVEPLLAGFETDRVACVCGLVLPMELKTDAQVGFEYCFGFGGMGPVPLRFDEAYRDAANRAVAVWDIGAGANMAVRRSTARALGGFDERIGPGAAGGCGDDSELWYRMLSAGYEARYEPLSIVRHVHRTEWTALRQQARGYFKGHLVALFAQFAHDRDWRNLRQVFFDLPVWIIRRVISRAIWRYTGPDMFHFAVLPGDVVRGYLSGLTFLHWALVRPPTQDRATRNDHV